MVSHRAEQVSLLNQDLMGEHQAIVHYLTHAWTVVHAFGDGIEAIARDEMRHFKWLAHAIVSLGGMPDLKQPDLLPVLSGEEALDYDIDAEEEAISQYEAHQKAISDERIQALLGRIVVDERDHHRRFLAMRRRWIDTEAKTPDVTLTQGEPFQILIAHEYHQILEYLMRSFMVRHGRQIGLDWEDQAVDAMKHMSWMAKALRSRGGVPHLITKEPDGDVADLFGGLKSWADREMPELIPLINRILAHEAYREASVYDNGWTVGSGQEGGWT